MALSGFDKQQRTEKSRLLGAVKLFAWFAVLVSVALFSYQYAIERVKAREATLDDANREMAKKYADLDTAANRLRLSLRDAQTHARELEDRLAKEVPAGERGRLFRVMNERLDAGVPIGRVEFLLSNARSPTNCQPLEGRKVPVGLRGRVAARPVVIASGILTLKAEGDPTRDRAGNAENGFDASKPASIHISGGGREWVVSGVPPLSQSIVVEGKEYHLAFTAGGKTNLELSAEVCDFP